MIVSQLDCIRISCVLRPLAKPLLKVLMTWIAERRHDCWLSIFYASFIFLREIALATHDAYDHGKRKKTFNPNVCIDFPSYRQHIQMNLTVERLKH